MSKVFEKDGEIRVWVADGAFTWCAHVSHTYDNQYWRKLGATEIIHTGDRACEEGGQRYELVDAGIGCAAGTFPRYNIYRPCGPVPKKKKRKKPEEKRTVLLQYHVTEARARELARLRPHKYCTVSDIATMDAAVRAVAKLDKEDATRQKKLKELETLKSQVANLEKSLGL